ncbi:hypothetical protein [[Eubacterium] hominis]|uniref:hypothetical protein n=1 Tax=[Eubacterium] hominis TaxID=2764325 RepID=UPI003A4D8993
MKEVIYTLRLDKYDYGIILNTLNEKRNQMIQENEDTEIIDNTLMKVIDANVRMRGSERNER